MIQELYSVMSNGRLLEIQTDLVTQLFDYASDVSFFVKDKMGRYTSVNDSLASRHGLTRAEVIGKRPCEICVGDLGTFPAQQDQKVLQTGRPLVEHLEMQPNMPGDPVWCLTTKFPIRNEDGDVVGIIGFSRDLTQPVSPNDVPREFGDAIQEFEESLAEDVSPRWLAMKTGLSPQKLARLTKRLFSLTPTQLITKIRITAACQMLANTNHSVSNIAFDCGFRDHSAFTRSFRSALGFTPTDYRQRKRKVRNNK